MASLRLSAIGILAALLVLNGCSGDYHTFADRPGFKEFYKDRCRTPAAEPAAKDLDLLETYRPRLVLPPGGSYPIDFYRDYLPFTVLRSWPGKKVIALNVTRGLLLKHRLDRGAYVHFDTKRYRESGRDLRWEKGAPLPGPDRKPVVYGRVYRERVSFPDGKGGVEEYDLTFLKYNILFAKSGLPARLPAWPGFLLGLTGLDGEDWHVLDNFVAAHVVLDGSDEPIAVVLAQHNHHRSYLLGRDIPVPEDGRVAFDIALRSNEIYPASDSPEPVGHRVIRQSLFLDYLLSGENGPALRGEDLTWGKKAGGLELDYEMRTLSPCDPLYTSEMLLGQPRPLLGLYIGRDGPPGSDYYNIPELLPMGNMLKYSYLHDGDPEDIAVVREAMDKGQKKIDMARIMAHGGRRFLEDWKAIRKPGISD